MCMQIANARTNEFDCVNCSFMLLSSYLRSYACCGPRVNCTIFKLLEFLLFNTEIVMLILFYNLQALITCVVFIIFNGHKRAQSFLALND